MLGGIGRRKGVGSETVETFCFWMMMVRCDRVSADGMDAPDVRMMDVMDSTCGV